MNKLVKTLSRLFGLNLFVFVFRNFVFFWLRLNEMTGLTLRHVFPNIFMTFTLKLFFKFNDMTISIGSVYYANIE